MEKATREQLFEACRHVMSKLGDEEYAYQFDPVDLAVLPAWDQLSEVLEENNELACLADFHVSDRFHHELRWLCAFSSMHTTLHAYVRQHNPPAPVYYPFGARLETLQKNVDIVSACGILSHSDDRDIFLTAAMARENPLYLSIAEKLLAAVDAEMEGTVPCPLTRHELLLIHELYHHLMTSGPASVWPSGYRKPSTVTHDEWLWAYKRGTRLIEPQERSLWKASLFASIDEGDSLWKKIAHATSWGLLGNVARVSTARPKKTRHTHDFIVSVSTRDSEDHHERDRLRSVLADMGITQELTYKQVPPSSLDAIQSCDR